MTVKEGGSDSAPETPNDEAVERVKAFLDLGIIAGSDADAAIRHLLSRYERMEKALETVSVGLPLLATDPVKWAEYTADLARQALGASE